VDYVRNYGPHFTVDGPHVRRSAFYQWPMKLTPAKVNIHDMLRITTHIVSMCSSGIGAYVSIFTYCKQVAFTNRTTGNSLTNIYTVPQAVATGTV